MTQKVTLSKPKLDIQPNDITEAKYEFTALQKNIIYEIIGQLQHLMSKDMVKINELNREDLKSVSELAGSNNHRKVIDQSKELMKKVFEYDYNKNNKKHLRVTTLIHSIDHEYYSDVVRLQISPGAVPVLLYIGNGFTQFQKTIAITLKSIHAKRMYELCCQWRDKKGFNWTLDKFKAMIGLHNKYASVKDLKSRVLNIAEKELKKHADIWFEFEIPRKRKGEEQRIIVNIETNENMILSSSKSGDKYSFVWRFINYAHPNYIDDSATSICDLLIKKDLLDNAQERFSRLEQEYIVGDKSKEDLIKLIKHILKTDFQIELNK